jgi:saccharopepsin
LNKEIGAKKSWNGAYTVDCDKVPSLPDITFTFAGNNFSLPATDYIMQTQGTCISSFQGLDIPPPLGTQTPSPQKASPPQQSQQQSSLSAVD